MKQLNATVWDDLFAAEGATNKTKILHERIVYLMDVYFPLKQYSVKSTDDPWVTDHFRKEKRKEKEEYKKNGRTEKYYKLKKTNRAELAKSKEHFYNKECGKMTTPGSHAISFNALKNINKPSRPKSWNVMDMFTDCAEDVALEKMGTFFNKIRQNLFQSTTTIFQ